MNTNAELKAVAKRYLEFFHTENKERDECYDILPINKIHGMDITVEFKMFNSDLPVISFSIRANKIYDEDYDLLCNKVLKIYKQTKKTQGKTFAKTTEEDVEKFIVECFDFVRDCKFNRFTGKFEIIQPMLCGFIGDYFKDIQHVELSTCCVCHEMTQTTTKCGHRLCKECWCQLKAVENKEDECMEQLCPMCRVVLGP